MKLMDVQLPRYFIYQSVYTPTLTYGHKFWVIPPPKKKKIVDTNSSNEFSPEGGWVQPW